MNKRLLILLLLLALTILLGVLQKDKEAANVSETDNLLVSDMIILDNYILATSEPYYTKYQVLGVMTDKVAYKPNLSDKQYYDLIKQYSWNIDTAYEIMKCESSGNPEAVNWKDKHRGCNGSFGLFQVGCVHIGPYNITNHKELYDPETNIAVAYEVWKSQGWNAWKNCYNKI